MDDPRPALVAFGDSLTAGYGIDLDEAWPARLQERLDTEGFGYRVVNAGVSGETTSGGLRRLPFVLALQNDDDGIHVDALLTRESDVHNLFSSTLANFHVTSPHYHELSAFLRSIMPGRPLGLHYSTIGFNHVGKVAVMTELREELSGTGERLDIAAGFPGTVAIGFSSPSSAYNLKVIRDHPTSGYKWGDFEGIDSVQRKYSQVHRINRTGSMLDNIIYYHLRLDRDWFEPALLDELCSQAGESVATHGDAVVFKHLIVQRRMVPLHLYLESAAPAEAETAIVNLGFCIKNNAAANIFNKDLDARNYGVSSYGKVYLYDYDALEPFTDVKIRSNIDRIEGEEDVPEWYFEEGVVFLPEEMITGLRIRWRDLQERFRAVHGDLLTVGYWDRIQSDLLAGNVPGIRVSELLPRVAMRVDPTVGVDQPPLTEAAVTVHLADGRRCARRVRGARGYPSQPPSAAELDAKFLACAARAVSPAAADAALAWLRDLERQPAVSALAELVREPVPA